ncbi:hypothetical protein K461DRAFT_291751 [Myriangium duriaei CBS 260.36]|uniref:BTB domain-containing protein n=1 Tax=Myriangium duriaei CBS 260.36 TaxID=1168546 RepID=A0A9P4MPN6_9PEZI|nr:hypothetical protein K461DRAFT_291751 [Myriangium duriaei CBS 260.36]
MPHIAPCSLSTGSSKVAAVRDGVDRFVRRLHHNNDQSNIVVICAGARYYVRKDLLCCVSLYFDDMLQLNSHISEIRLDHDVQDLPIVQIMLALVYGIEDCAVASFDEDQHLSDHFIRVYDPLTVAKLYVMLEMYQMPSIQAYMASIFKYNIPRHGFEPTAFSNVLRYLFNHSASLNCGLKIQMARFVVESAIFDTESPLFREVIRMLDDTPEPAENMLPFLKQTFSMLDNSPDDAGNAMLWLKSVVTTQQRFAMSSGPVALEKQGVIELLEEFPDLKAAYLGERDMF